MAEQVKFDYSLTAGVISEDEMKAMEKITKDAKDVLVGKSGAGNDFLGWIDLPVDYDKEEFLEQELQSSSYVTAFTITYRKRSARPLRSITAVTI